MNHPLVSIVIVCYNQAHFLTEAIRSALSQTYRSLEFILVDDGSTDDTPAVARDYATVHYIRTVNSGLAAARNSGLRAAAGEFIVFLDADDRLLSNAVQTGLECFQRFPHAAFVCGAFRKIHADGSPAPTDPQQRVRRDHYLRLLHGNFIAMHGAVMYRCEILAAEGGFDPSLRACEDYELYLRLTRRWTMAQHEVPVADYRQHDSSMSRDYPYMLRSVLRVLNAEKHFIVDTEQRRALRKGIKSWKNYYGKMLLEDWHRSRGLSRLLTALQLNPSEVFRRAAQSLRRRALEQFGPGWMRMGSLRRLSPVSQKFGADRGQPVDRYYIESFLAEHAESIHGRVLEIGNDAYSRRFGGSRITAQDILHFERGFPGATIHADLADAPHIPNEQFDCIILTQTLHYIFDLPAAIATLHRILKPGGTLLVTMPGISRLCTDQADKESDCWRFTATSARRLLTSAFGPLYVEVSTFGNVLAAIAFLEGLATQELRPHELDHHDPHYPMIIAAAAMKKVASNEPRTLSLQDARTPLSSDRERDPRPLVTLRHP